MPNELPSELFDILINKESKWKADAVNPKTGAVGLGQIMPSALEDFNFYNKESYKMSDMFDPQKNMRVSYWYLYNRIPQMLQAYKIPVNIDSVLGAYNFGVGNIRKKKPLPEETINYITSIKQQLFGGQPLTLE